MHEFTMILIALAFAGSTFVLGVKLQPYLVEDNYSEIKSSTLIQPIETRISSAGDTTYIYNMEDYD